jgi:hypothetical protein
MKKLHHFIDTASVVLAKRWALSKDFVHRRVLLILQKRKSNLLK